MEDLQKTDPESDLLKHLESLKKDPYQKSVDTFGDNHQFLIHGDLWNNNVMFAKTDKEVKDLSCKFLDFQQFGSGEACDNVYQL